MAGPVLVSRTAWPMSVESEDLRSEWLQDHAPRLAMALVPANLRREVRLPAAPLARIATKVATRCAEVLRRRCEQDED